MPGEFLNFQYYSFDQNGIGCTIYPLFSFPVLVPSSGVTGIVCGTVWKEYDQTSNIRRTFVDNKIVDHSDVVGASPVGAAPTTSSFSA